MGKRDTAIFLTAIALTVLGVVRVFYEAAVPTASWGLSFRQEGSAPVGTAGMEQLRQYDAAYLGDTREKVLYLTFDAGYENGNVEKILDALKKHNAQGAFFVLEHLVKCNTPLVCRMAEEGHLVCNHSNTHKDLSTGTSPQVFLDEIQGLAEKYEQLIGQKMPNYVRPPEGKYSESFLKLCQEYDYIPVFWSFAYKDWLNDAQPSHEEAIQTILSRTHPGEIALLHSTSATNAAILGEVIDRWHADGYTIKTLDDLKNEQLQSQNTSPSA